MKKMHNKKLNLFILYFLILTVIIMVGICVYKLYKDKNDFYSGDIIKYELQTHEYFIDSPEINKYLINSDEELSNFYSIYSDKLNIDKDYLKNNIIFIQIEQVGSGSIQMNLRSVTFDNNTVNFIIDKNYPEIGTTDMAFWYFVAIIPKNKVTNLNLSDWSIPSKVLANM